MPADPPSAEGGFAVATGRYILIVATCLVALGLVSYVSSEAGLRLADLLCWLELVCSG
jgi:hypothetical protein